MRKKKQEEMKLKDAHKVDRVLVHRANKIFNAGNIAITASYFSVS